MSAQVGTRSGPVLPEMPDLSHLTEEERKIILGVMDRQKKEEEKEQSMLKGFSTTALSTERLRNPMNGVLEED
ncbi:Regulating synaptic membrane exocytosis protein 2 [Triplophysa tibetana]|uniref:Regulating synaptic membrane exocytosis protein 2 n=1 Tax=Triplophysa tibetana TaxID=1572043 RepID=A0A5A9N1C0_9TELE|nr:Regulating synaptic membrane exocytosis protein 2 [Triplophysa tibetana]